MSVLWCFRPFPVCCCSTRTISSDSVVDWCFWSFTVLLLLDTDNILRLGRRLMFSTFHLMLLLGSDDILWLGRRLYVSGLDRWNHRRYCAKHIKSLTLLCLLPIAFCYRCQVYLLQRAAKSSGKRCLLAANRLLDASRQTTPLLQWWASRKKKMLIAIRPTTLHVHPRTKRIYLLFFSENLYLDLVVRR